MLLSKLSHLCRGDHNNYCFVDTTSHFTRQVGNGSVAREDEPQAVLR